ncbi:MAG: DsbA family protein [Hyphomicrobiales bacterium]
MSNAHAQSPQSRTDADIEKLVHEYILKNPEVIIEALQAFERQREEQLAADQQRQIQANADILHSSDHQIVIGNPEGDVTLIEFFDYNCGFCRQTLATVEALIEQDPKIKVILKEFPVLGPGSQEAARISIAASKIAPAKYKDLHTQLLSSQGQVNERIALALSANLGIDTDELQSLSQTRQVEEAIGEVYQLASELGINGTPSFIIGNELIPGAVDLDVLQQKVSAMRECGKTTCS